MYANIIDKQPFEGEVYMKFKNILALALVFCCIFAMASCRKLDANSEYEKVTEVYVVGDDGEEYTLNETVNEEGETEYFYRDNNGVTVTVKAKAQDNGKTEYVVVNNKGEEVTVATTVKTKAVRRSESTSTTAVNGSASQESDVSLTPEQESFLSNFDESNIDQYLDNNAQSATLVLGENIHNLDKETTINVVKTADGLPLHDNSEFFSNLSKQEKYTLKFTMQTAESGSTSSMPVTIIKSGDKMYMEMSMPIESTTSSSTGSMTCFIIVKNGTCKAYIPNIKGYMEVPADTLEELKNEVALGTTGQSSGTYIGTTRITLKGITYDVDMYEDNGTTVYYYYNGSTPKRVEYKSSDGTTSIIEYNTINYTADESKFKDPVGYYNMTDLMQLG